MNQPKGLIVTLLEIAFMLFLSAYLIQLAVCYIMAVWEVLAVLVAVIVVGTVVYRIWKNKSEY